MNPDHQFWAHRERGAILVVSLIVTLVMTTMGVGLFYVSNRSFEQMESNTSRSETLYSAETCIEDVIRWMKVTLVTEVPCKSGGVGGICHTIGAGPSPKTMDSAWRQEGESSTKGQSKVQRRMAQHEYKCTLKLTAIVSSPEEKYLYKIESEGKGPNRVRSDVEVVLSIAPSEKKGGSDVGQGTEYNDPES